jgi:putative oxidoreductase
MTYIREQSSPQREVPARPASPVGRPTASSLRRTAYPGGAVVERVADINARYAPTVLRVALALVFLWFGALKISGVSPVRELIASTLPFISPDVSVPVMGAAELVIGLALLIGRFPRITLLILAGHLTGTFLTFIMASRLMVQHGNPWQLTADGEFVVKNLVLISAALVLIGFYSRGTAASRGA